MGGSRLCVDLLRAFSLAKARNYGCGLAGSLGWHFKGKHATVWFTALLITLSNITRSNKKYRARTDAISGFQHHFVNNSGVDHCIRRAWLAFP
jgi:hypothetical protein